MIINGESPLRRLPLLDRKVTLFLDGIRCSVEMADLAYSRLQNTLFNLTHNCDNPSTRHWEFISAISDAWSVVDSVHRLRGLLKCAPFITKGSPGLSIFEQHTETIKLLRNSIQHLYTKIDMYVSQGLPVLGALGWFAVLDLDSQIGFSCSLLAGTMFKGLVTPIVNPASSKRDIMLPVDFVTLTASGYSVCISDVMKHVEQVIKDMEKQLRDQIKTLERPGSDVIIRLHQKLEW